MPDDAREQPPPDAVRALLLRQLETSWQLLTYHLESLETGECLWRPASHGLHVTRVPDGTWRAEWPAHEGYDLGPPSAAWITWHIHFWWSMVLDQHWRNGTHTREAIAWPGSAHEVKAAIAAHHAQWVRHLEGATWPVRARWPFVDRPFADVVAWLNLELMKNAAELGYVRFLYAARPIR